MTIAENKVVTLHYTLTDNEGTVIDKSDDGSFLYLHGASNIIPGLENALTGKKSGEELKVTVEPEDAYGQRDDARLESVPREMFPEDTEIEAGMQFHAEGPGGAQVITITLVEGDDITIDANHPLAGKTLHFEVSIEGVRDATAEEIDHGHVH